MKSRAGGSAGLEGGPTSSRWVGGTGSADLGAGVIRDPAIHQRVLRELQGFVAGQSRLRWIGVTESPLLGPAGNKEFLVLIEKLG